MKRALYFLTIVLLSGVFLYSGSRVYSYYAEGARADRQFGELADLVQPSGSTTAGEKYAALFARNDDMVGWLSIEGTTVDYPVMQTPEQPDYYLDHDFEKRHSDYGVPYVTEHADVLLPSDNVLIYGHHMKDGRMFGALEDYKSESFYRKHRVVRFDTRDGPGEYVILAVLLTTPEKFAYERFVQAEDAAAFEAYVARCTALSLYDTGESASYGDKLLTLSTCEYSEESGRLVVVAKRVTSPETAGG